MPEFTGRLRTPRLASAPASPVVGELYYDMAPNKLRWWNGTTWMPEDSGGGGAITVYKTTITGDGTTKLWTITHNLNTRDVNVVIREWAAPYEHALARVKSATLNHDHDRDGPGDRQPRHLFGLCDGRAVSTFLAPPPPVPVLTAAQLRQEKLSADGATELHASGGGGHPLL